MARDLTHPRLTALAACFGFYLPLILSLLLLILAFLLLDSHAESLNPPPISLSTAQNLLDRTLERTEPDTRRLVLNRGDMEAIATFLLLRKGWHGAVSCDLHAPRLLCRFSIRLHTSLPWFVNAELTLQNSPSGLELTQLRLGRLSLRQPVALWLLEKLQWPVATTRLLPLKQRLVKALFLERDELHIILKWDDELFKNAENWLQNWVSEERFRVYQHALQKTLAAGSHKRFVRLAGLIQALFSLARERSLHDNPPIDENSATILVLNAYVNGGVPKTWLNFASDNPAPPRLQVLLKGRVDTARHFLVSAALSLASDHNALTDLLGLAKELNDTHGGTGFSFIDLAADRSGELFAKACTDSEPAARLAQDILSQGADEARFMADTSGLPEHLDTPHFEPYQAIDTPTFTALHKLIETRIENLPIQRSLQSR